jgi:hypothetical protein
MGHPLLKALLEQDGVQTIGPDGLDRFLNTSDGRLGVVFLAGDPEKKVETADVAIVLMELLKAHEGALNIGVVHSEAEAEVMKALSVFALPSLVFLAGHKRLETIPKIQDWSVYAEALPRLIDTAQEEAPA